MRAQFEMRETGQPRLSDVQVNEVRALLLTAIAEQYAEFERHEARLVAGWPDDTTGLVRAMAALEMFSAREAIEAIAAALARIDDRGFGDVPVVRRTLEVGHP